MCHRRYHYRSLTTHDLTGIQEFITIMSPKSRQIIAISSIVLIAAAVVFRRPADSPDYLDSAGRRRPTGQLRHRTE
ncbi:MAG: hypothetical protein R2849_21390 [Thermomicrobiales bacterium]